MLNHVLKVLPFLVLSGMVSLHPISVKESFAQETSRSNYQPHPDTTRKDGVPTGEILGPFEWKSKIYPGTTRNYHLYVPAQYKELAANGKPACVFVVQDGIGRARDWKLHETMDNLIAEGSMPITIGIFVDHGVVAPTSEDAQPRFNRSFEYDSLGDRYARFLLEEILPEVSKSYNISNDPNDRAIGGASSGRFVHSTSLGKGLMNSGECFRRLVPTLVFAEPIKLRRWSVRQNRSRFESICKTVRMISTSMLAIGGMPTKVCLRR